MNQNVQPDRDSSGKRRQDDNGSGNSNDGDAGVSLLTKRLRTSSFAHQPTAQTCRSSSPPRTGIAASSYTVAWICAIPCELAAAMAMLDEEHPYLQDQSEDDSNHYTLGSISGHNVAIACLPTPQYGNVNAANVLTNLRRTFPSIRTCLMVGVGAGVPSRDADIRLGDVVVGIRVMPYELGKVGADGEIQQINSPVSPEPSLGTLLSTIRAKHDRAPSRIPSIMHDRFPAQLGYTRPNQPDRLFSASYEHVMIGVSKQGEEDDKSNSNRHFETGIADPCEKCDGAKVHQRPARISTAPNIHYGAIGSGEKLMKNGSQRDSLARKLDVICFEMESAGLMSVMRCLPIRGICDYADTHKNKRWQKYAAAVASAYARELLEIMPVALSETQRAKSSQKVDPKDDKVTQGRRDQILSTLAFAQQHDRRKSIKKAQAKTCQWFLQIPEYQQWQESAHHHNHHGFLWIRGKPGVGKSTMMKHLLDAARKLENGTDSFSISFFFHARGDKLEKSVFGMYRSLLYQMLNHFRDLQEVLEDREIMLQNSDGDLSLRNLKELFQTAISRLGSRRLTCFVDALDEGDEQQITEMVQFFEEIAEQSVENSVYFRACLSSRHYPYIEVEYGLKVSLEDQDGHKDDLRKYVREKLRIKDVRMLEDLEAQLVDKSQGVFLWLELVVDILNKENVRGRLAMKKRLAEFPPKLGDLFRDILARDNKNMDDLLVGISWILFAKRPLSLLEYHHAFWTALARSGSADADEDMPNTTADDAEECAERCVLISSKGLAEVTQAKRSRKGKRPHERTVQFIHESVRDYLLKDGGMNELWPDLPFDIEAQSHEQLKECCLFYLRHRTVAGLIGNLKSPSTNPRREEALLLSPKVPLLEYVSQYVLSHADAAEALFPQDEVLGMFCSTEWSKLFNMYEKHKNQLFRSTNSLVYMLADKGLSNLIRIRIRTEARHGRESGMRYRFPLHAAFARKDERTAAALLGLDPLSIRFLDGSRHLVEVNGQVVSLPDNSHSPLSWAAGAGLLEVVRTVIEQEADVNESNHSGWRALDFALEKSQGEVAQFLLENGAETSSPYTLDIGLQDAARRGDMSMVRTLVSMRAPTDKALCVALAFSQWGVAKVLLAHGAKMADPTSLTKAVLDGFRANFTTMMSYLRHGGKPEVLSWNTEKLLLLAAKVGLNVDGYLEGVDINCRNEREETPLMVAVEARNGPAVKTLLENGADVGARCEEEETALHKAAGSGADEATVSLLIDRGSDVRARSKSGAMPLHIASGHQKNEAVVSLLLKHGSPVDALDGLKDTPLLKAVSSSCRAVVATLLRHGADAIAVRAGGRTPLATACSWGNYSIVSELIRHGCSASINTLSPTFAPLHLASSVGELSIVRLLLLAGADINVRGGDHMTPLHLAAFEGQEAVVTALLERVQCDADASDGSGRTPLYLACQENHVRVARLLLERGASPMLPAVSRTDLVFEDIKGVRVMQPGDPQRVLDMLIAGSPDTVKGNTQEDLTTEEPRNST